MKAHACAIFRKLGVTNRTQAALAAVRMEVDDNRTLAADHHAGYGHAASVAALFSEPGK